MTIHWANLGLVFLVSVAATVGVVLLFSAGVVGLSHRPRDGGQDLSGASGLHTSRHPASTAAAVFCFAVCALIVAYGLYLIVAR